MLDKLEVAFRPLSAANNPFVLLRAKDPTIPGETISVDLGALLGKFEVLINYDQSLLLLNSPVSGQYAYGYDRFRHEWRNTQDGHDFTGMLVRDWIRVASGVPKL